ncbi:endo-1,3(4)-beta-glucanase, putative [Trichophyton verrucosum HKI 0517]|uniref:Endo-1,3(4)-beta-glucanase, putative n=1 Tax=Trichophyton verrucosum (strain HKI 0517) TaxID=663202 RepID=D4D2T9_TRIVH|nr:endo-1,3(4)-beta-glucanase, putative [Trichophyton verrucosum HKI 0517]EFE43821.1 endo-1,3(4)-beta-glucanase, putative [Trichophyton verrucosum HKI 0517]
MRGLCTVPLTGFFCSTLLLGLATASTPASSWDKLQQRDLNHNNPSDPCDCYVVSGEDPGYFKHHRFYDFRNRGLELAADKEKHQQQQRRNITSRRLPGTGRGGIPGHIPGSVVDFDSKGRDNEAGGAPDPNADSNEFHPTLAGSRFIEDWDVQNWNREGSALFPIPIRNSHHNVFIVRNSTERGDETTHMVLRTVRMENHTSTAEVQTHDTDIFHVSLRVRLRLYANSGWFYFPKEKGGNISTVEDDAHYFLPTSYWIKGPPVGACAGVFTYYGKNDESDIEILTGDPSNLVRYANQPDWDPKTDESIPGASDEVEIAIPWTHWGDHRIDWFQDISRWYFNGEQLVSKTYGVPKHPSMLILNLWSDGGEWTGNMTVGSSVYMGVEWVEMVYNKTSDVEGAHKKHIRAGLESETEGDEHDKHEDSEGAQPRANKVPSLQPARHGRPRPKKKQVGKGKIGGRPKNKGTGKGKGKHKGKKPKTKPKPNDEDSQEEKCKVVCRVDGVRTQGVPEVI